MVELTKEEEKEIKNIMFLNKYMSYQQAVSVVLNRSNQERIVGDYEKGKEEDT